MLPRRLLVDAVVHVRLSESLMHHWSHHLNLRVQGYTGSGILGGFHDTGHQACIVLPVPS